MLRRMIVGAAFILVAATSFAFDNYDDALKASVEAYGKPDMAAAASAAEEAVKLAPTPAVKADALYHLGHCYNRLGKQAEAVKAWDEAQQIPEAPANTKVACQVMKAEVYYQMGKPDESIQANRALLEMADVKPDTKAAAISSLSLALAQQQKYDDARAELEKGMNADWATPAQKAQMLLAEGAMYTAQKSYDKARESYGKVSALEVPALNKTQAQVSIAQSYMAEGKQNEARDAYAKVLEIPDATPIYKAISLGEMAKIDLANMKPADAKADYQKIVDMPDIPADAKASAEKAIKDIDAVQLK